MRAPLIYCLLHSALLAMSGLIEQLGTLRAVGIDGDEKQLQLLLRTAGYNLERAINHYFESGLPGLPSSAPQECVKPSPSPPAPAPTLTAVPPSRPVADRPAEAAQVLSLTRGSWPKLVGERWITGYSTRRGSLQFREKIDIVSEGSGTSRASPQGKAKAQGKLWGGRGGRGGGGGRFGRPKASSAGAMSHILFRGSKGGVEGRLPREVCTFLAPLLQKGLVRARAEAVCDLPGLGVFADVPLMLSFEIEEGVFALDPDEELYRNAYCLLQFAHTGHIEQELQPKTQQASGHSSGGGGSAKGDGTGLAEREPAAAAAAAAGSGQQVKMAEGNRTGSEEEEEEEEKEEGAQEAGVEEEEATRIREEDAEKLYQSGLCEMPEAGDPGLFVEGLTLRRYQRQALAWMIQREKKRYVTEEDCTGLSLGAAGGDGGGGGAAAAAAASASGTTEAETTAGHNPPSAAGDDGSGERSASVSMRDGCVSVASWSRSATNGAGGADCGGGAGVAMHPLWERRAAASRASTRGSVGLSEGRMFGAVPLPCGGAAAAGEEQGPLLSQPEAFYVNVYSRRFQREFPPATLGCRGGILADEMGMGKTVMLLSLILSDKERQQGDRSGVLVHVEDKCKGREDQDQEEEEEEEGEGEELDGDLTGGGGGGKSSTICLDHDDDDPHEKDGDEGAVDGGGRQSAGGSTGDAVVAEVLPRKRRRAPAPAPAQNPAALPSGGSIATTKRRRRTTPSSSSSSASTLPPSSTEPFHVSPSSSSNDSSGSSAESEFMPSPGKGHGTNTGSSESDDNSCNDDGDSDSDFDPGTAVAGNGKSRAAAAAASTGSSKRRRGGTSANPSNSSNGNGTCRRDGKKRPAAGGRGGGHKVGSHPSAPLEDSDDVETLEIGGGGEGDGDGDGNGAGARVVVGRGGRRADRGDGGMHGGTLVVCPLSLIGQWRGELESKTRKGAISVCFHYGAGRSRSTRELCRKDVVLTTYGVLSSEMAKHEADAKARASTASATAGGAQGTAGSATAGGGAAHKTTGGLLGVRWSRVILDEAHSIRNTSTEQSRACLALEAEQRWAVTGTPIQNSLDDMAALLAFLRHEPWSDRGWWRKVIADPYKDGDMEALRRLKTVLAPILLRRTKNTLDSRGRPIVELPSKTVEIVRLELSPEEREFYEALKKRSKIEFEGYVAAGTVMKSYIAILTLLLRLRQACNHPFLVLGKSFSSSSSSSSAPDMMRQKQKQQQQASLKPAASPAGTDANGLDLQDAGAGGVDGGGGGEDAGSAPPHYVQELYRRYRERVAADKSKSARGVGNARENGGRREDREVEAEHVACCDGGGVVAGGGSLAFVDSVVGQLRADGERPREECPVCLEEPMASPALTPCAHLMCRDCLRDCLQREACCPVCRSEMAEADMIEIHDSQPTVTATASSPSHPSGAAAAARKTGEGAPRGGGGGGSSDSGSGGGGGGGGGWIGSTKLGQLELELREMRRKRPGAKAVVFSQWTHMLDLAETSMGRGGWTHRRLDGTMSQQRRESALKSFATDESVAVMLVSLKAGGVGLNLTAASTVILLDPWWNPAVEEQAIDRIHRLGQLNEVSVKRFVVEGTVEDKMLALQEVKGRMAKNALAAGSVSESQKLRVEDLIQFFK